jgi:hypothetical protein
MSLINIIILVILALVLLWGLNNIFLKTNIIYDKMCEASAESTEIDATSSSKNIIAAKDIPETTASNFTLSVWFYIDNWGNDIGNEKNILFMAKNYTARTFTDFIEATTPFSGISTYTSSGPPTSSTTIYKNINIALDKYENNLFIDIECFPDRQPTAGSTANQTIYARYKIPNVSVQKWNNLTISVDGRTLDVYLDGKLRNSFILHGLYKNFYSNNAKKHIYLGTLPGGTTSNGNKGFEGFITRVRFEGDSCNPQDAYNIYKEGIDASLTNSIYNKYSLKVSFLEYNKEKGSFKI